MGRARRPYIKKTKGCYECSQRRIHCDKREPSCDKCISKGLECSGIGGQTPRFRNGFTPKRKQRIKSSQSNFTLDSQNVPILPLESEEPQNQIGENDSHLLQSQGLVHVSEGKSNRHRSRPALPEHDSPITLNIDHIAPWQRFLLKHFSDYIAPEMVIIDDDSNGWRHLVLPLACADELIMYSVLAVAAFHFSRTAGQHIASPAKLYSKTIFELQKRRDLRKYDVDARYRIIVTIVVLLLATMVEGNSDFAIIFRMLQSALDIVNGEQILTAGNGMMAKFSSKQIRKMRVYASPFISQDAGVNAVAAQAEHCWDDQEQSFLPHSDHSLTLPLISSLRRIAFQIYLLGALQQKDTDESLPNLLSRFGLLLESCPRAFPGEHVLIWPVFIAASASYTPEQKRYFAHFLERQFSRNGFANIEKALESLRRIWARNIQDDWTTLLPEQGVFVM